MVGDASERHAPGVHVDKEQDVMATGDGVDSEEVRCPDHGPVLLDERGPRTSAPEPVLDSVSAAQRPDHPPDEGHVPVLLTGRDETIQRGGKSGTGHHGE
jgi:hypothetical protein